jgi:RNA polymerase sigma factor (sigma-70 family)
MTDRAVRYGFGLAATQDRREECWAHVVSCLDRIADGWDPSKSSLEQRMVYCFYWFGRHWARDTLRRLRREYAHGTSGAYSDPENWRNVVENAESNGRGGTDRESRAVSGETEEEREVLDRIMENLNEYQRWLVRAYYLEDRSLRDIGEQVGVSRQTIHTDLVPVERLLREALRGYR